MIQVGVALVETPSKLYRKARVELDDNQIRILNQRKVLQEVIDLDGGLQIPEAGAWTGVGPKGPVTVRQLKGCSCGGTTVMDKATRVTTPA